MVCKDVWTLCLSRHNGKGIWWHYLQLSKCFSLALTDKLRQRRRGISRFIFCEVTSQLYESDACMSLLAPFFHLLYLCFLIPRCSGLSVELFYNFVSCVWTLSFWFPSPAGLSVSLNKSLVLICVWVLHTVHHRHCHTYGHESNFCRLIQLLFPLEWNVKDNSWKIWLLSNDVSCDDD